MARGGVRPNSGRKKGSPNRQRIEREEAFERMSQKLKALGDEDLLPLDVMMACMKAAIAEGNMKMAYAFAKDAAVYFHARPPWEGHLTQDTTIRDERAPFEEITRKLSSLHEREQAGGNLKKPH